MTALPAAFASSLEVYPRRCRYLVGVSGGADSMALLHALHAAGFHKLVVCHFDHGLRPDSARAEKSLVSRAAARLGCDFEFEPGDTRCLAREKKLSIEAAARDLRFAFFARCGIRRRCNRVFLAHHADDQLETVLLNLCRGTGLAGLGGMRRESSHGSLQVLRPLLGIPGADLRSWIAARRVSFVEDPGNRDRTHSRNRLRHDVLPVLFAAMGDSSRAAILRMAEIVRSENDWLESLVGEPGSELEVRGLRGQPEAMQRRTVLKWLKKEGISDAGFDETLRVLSLLAGTGAPAKVNLPGNLHARRKSGRIFLSRPAGPLERGRKDQTKTS